MADSKTLKAVISIAGNLDPSLQKSIAQATKQTSGIGTAMKVVGAVGAAGLAAAGAAAVSATKKLVDLGTQFDSASDAIRVGTGATGEALQALNKDFDAVYSAVPTTMESASQAIADYNTRLGLTGEPLQQISEQALRVSDLLGDDLGGVIESSSQAFQQWGISADDMSAKMDYVFKASQSTGTGFTDLLGTIQQFGPQMQDMGFSFEQATALVGQLDKAGVNTSEVLSAMKKSVTTMAKDGLSASEGLAQYTEAIQNAGSAAEATAIASEVFGARAGSTMAAAIREGKLSVDELTKSLLESDETIQKAAEDTMDFPERLELLKQRASVALKPVANSLFDQLTDMLPYIESGIQKALPVIQNFGQQVGPVIANVASAIGPVIGDIVGGIGERAQLILPVLQDVFGEAIKIINAVVGPVNKAMKKVLSAFSSKGMSLDIGGIVEQAIPVVEQLGEIFGTVADIVATQVVPAIEPILSTVMNIVTSIMGSLAPAISSILTAVQQIFTSLQESGVVENLLNMIQSALQAIGPILSAEASVLSNIISSILPPLVSVISNIFNVLSPVFALISQLIQILSGTFGPVLTQIIGFLGTLGGAIVQNLQTAIGNAIPTIEGLKQFLEGLLTFITQVFSINWSQAWEGIKTTFAGIWNSLGGIVKAAFNGVIGVLNKAIDAINNVLGNIKIPEAVAKVAGISSFSLKLPKIPALANGGFTDGISIAGEAGTEAVISFRESERAANLSYWARAGKLLGVDGQAVDMLANNTGTVGTSNNITFSPNITINGDANHNDTLQALREAEQEFMDMLEEFYENKDNRSVVYG